MLLLLLLVLLFQPNFRWFTVQICWLVNFVLIVCLFHSKTVSIQQKTYWIKRIITGINHRAVFPLFLSLALFIQYTQRNVIHQNDSHVEFISFSVPFRIELKFSFPFWSLLRQCVTNLMQMFGSFFVLFTGIMATIYFIFYINSLCYRFFIYRCERYTHWQWNSYRQFYLFSAMFQRAKQHTNAHTTDWCTMKLLQCTLNN